MKIAVTREAFNAIRSGVEPGYTFRDTSTLRPDGLHEFDVSFRVYMAMIQQKLRGETLSDVIIRRVGLTSSSYALN